MEGAALVRSELERIRDAVRWLHDTVVERVNRGDEVWTLVREVQLPEHLSLGEGYGTVRWAVRAIVEGYLGWFHFESTTELYGVPASAVHADLVEAAGGPGPLLERARAHLDAGRPVEAIHLIEPVLTVEPAHAGARALEPIGWSILTGWVHERLVNRLRVVAWASGNPDVLDAPVEAPIVVAGMLRTGTTILSERSLTTERAPSW